MSVRTDLDDYDMDGDEDYVNNPPREKGRPKFDGSGLNKVLKDKLEPLDKPPVGVMKKSLWEEKVYYERVKELSGAIHRYIEANLIPDRDWVGELDSLLEKISRIRED